MIATVLYAAGKDETQRHVVALDASNMAEEKAGLVARFIEFWCQKNCRGTWRVEECRNQVVVSFAKPVDVVLFKFSPEYYEFEGRWGYHDEPIGFLLA